MKIIAISFFMCDFEVCRYLVIFEFVKRIITILSILAVACAIISIACVPESDVLRSSQAWSRVRRARIVAAGDLMQHRTQIVAAQLSDTTQYDYVPSFRYVAPYFQDADLAIVNLETTLSNVGPYTGYPCFSSPAQVADAMQYMGIDVAALANNHCCDRGAYGIKSTAEILDERGIYHVGVCRDSVDYKSNNILYIKRCGISFAIVNYTYGTNGIRVPSGMCVNLIDTVAMKRDLAQIDRDEVDCVVAVMHWGNEYERHANKEQKRLAKFLRQNGVDLILGSHPHVVQPYEIDSGGIILYSMGNFVSGQRTRYRDGGVVATIDVEIIERGKGCATEEKRARYNLSLTPVWVHLPDFTPVPAAVGDTMSMNYDSRFRYDRFMNDLREHIEI